MSKNKILIIDGSSYLYRAHHTPSLSRLTTPSGEPSGTVFGFNRSLSLLLDYHQPTHCCVVFDPRGKTQRHTFFPQYKANRPPTPPEIVIAYQQIQELLSVKKTAQIQIEKEEADDVIGSLSKTLEKQGNLIVIATGDKDLAQIVSPNIILTNIKNGEIEVLDSEGVKNKMGIYPNQVADFLALTGDSVDNIPGVPGVGAKTAVKLINQYQDLNSIIKNAHLISGKVGQAIQQQTENIPLYLRLTEINYNISVPLQLDDLKIIDNSEEDFEELERYYTKMGFVSELGKLNKRKTASLQTPIHQTTKTPIEIIKDFYGWFEQLQRPQANTPNKNPIFFIQEGDVLYGCLLNEKKVIGIKTINIKKEAPNKINKKIESTQQRIVVYDSKELKHKTNINPNTQQTIDLMVLYYVLNAGKASPQWKNIEKEIERTQPDLPPPDSEKIEFVKEVIARAKQYDFLQKQLLDELAKNPKISEVFTKIEQPLINVLSDIEECGVFINPLKLQEIDVIFSQQIGEVQKEVYQGSQEPFNIDSPKQVGEILYQKLKLPVLQKTPTGNPSTNEETLQKLAFDGHKIAKKIIQYRGLSKLQSTYTQGLLKHITPQNRIHTKLNQIITNTGRLSSSDPNLQNIPIKTENGRLIREAFCAPPGRVLMAIDYSQIELRILAHQTQDEQLMAAFNQDLDIHKVTAQKVFNLSAEQISSEQRRYAKTINFGLIYGMSAFSLSNQLKITVQEAKNWMEAYFKQFPKIEGYMEEVKNQAKQNGWVSTFMGRRIHTPDINNRNHKLRTYAERAAINAPIQGAAADIIKLAMIEVHKITQGNSEIDMVLQIHDELLFEVEENRTDHYKPLIKKIMQEIVPLSIPLKVDVGVAKNWAEAH